jgi:hypothetical protein
MLYRFKECLSRKQYSEPPSGEFFYRGVTKSQAEKDLAQHKLHFSRAIIHDDDTQDSEMFRTDEEKEFEYEKLGLRLEPSSMINEDRRSMRFFERADKLNAGLAYICSWSSSREAALVFATPLHDRALLQISQSDMVQCLQSCFHRWNSQQPSEHEIFHPDGSWRDDWFPRAVRFAFGKIDYSDRAECNTESPFLLSRAMRLPGGVQDGSIEQECEWRISLDISEIPSLIKDNRMIKTGLLPSGLLPISASNISDDLEPMISFNGETGLWLNDFRLTDAKSFAIETL